MEENIKMSLEDYPRFINDNDPELAIARALFLSTRPNSHGFLLSEEVLRKFAPTILGKFLVGNLNIFETDVMSHEKEPDIFGYIPLEQQVEFVRAEDGYLDAYVNIVVSKIYATKVYNLFLEDNFRNVSVEMRVMYKDEETKEVSEFNVAGLTVLSKITNPSVPNAHMEMIRFSQEEADNYYHNTFNQVKQMEKLAEVGKRYKIDKSVKALSNDDWSNVDKTKLRNTILNAQNKSALVKAVYLKVESNWEDTPSERLGYPVMQLKGDTFVYNRNALANAKARATQQNETEVLRKLSAIYNKLNLKEETENKEEAEEKMAKLEEEKKNVVMEQPTEEAPKEDEKKLAEDADKKEEEKEEVKDEKASDNSDSDKKDDEKKEEEEKASDDSDEKEEDKKEDDDKLSEAKAQCADLEAKCAELEAKLSKLEKFKADTEEKEKMAIVNQTLAQVKESMDSDTYAKFEEKAKEQTLDTVNAWRNEVLANVATVLMSAKKDESHLRMGIEEDFKTPTSLWDRM
jgi:hypothetical protein